jgi:hypothetical protein
MSGSNSANPSIQVYPNGGTITDSAGYNLIEISSGDATVAAGQGTDTIQGGTGALTISAENDQYDMVVQGGQVP